MYLMRESILASVLFFFTLVSAVPNDYNQGNASVNAFIDSINSFWSQKQSELRTFSDAEVAEYLHNLQETRMPQINAERKRIKISKAHIASESSKTDETKWYLGEPSIAPLDENMFIKLVDSVATKLRMPNINHYLNRARRYWRQSNDMFILSFGETNIFQGLDII